MSDQSTWVKPDGFTWTPASFVVRALCETDELTPPELYFVLVSLDEQRFRSYWDKPEFYLRAGMAERASDSLGWRGNGWIARTGDYAWAAGDLDEAMRRYQRSVVAGETAGIAGQVRLHFVCSEFHECIAAFRCGCPPHAFYIEYRTLRNRPEPDLGKKDFNCLCARFPKTSFCFVSSAKYMCRAIVTAALHAGGIDDGLREMICDYFEIEEPELSELIRILTDNDKELARLQRLITPKPAVSGRTFNDLLAEGGTEKARRVCDRVPYSTVFVDTAGALLDAFLESGDSARLDEMIRAGSPFSITEADYLVFRAAFEPREKAIAKAPYRRLVLLRRFEPMGRYPRTPIYPSSRAFLDDFIEIIKEIEAEILPSDVIAAMLGIYWSNPQYQIDDTGPSGSASGFGKPEIDKHREWLEIVLRDYPKVFNRDHFTTRDRAIDAIYKAYLFLRERYQQVRRSQRWFNEAQLADAIETLFGKGEVNRHARPMWLSPQHLDLFLPRYDLAIEYMGIQHYEPLGVFGGRRALEEMKIRDERKRSICEQMGVNLVYVTHTEDVGRCAREIFEKYCGR